MKKKKLTPSEAASRASIIRWSRINKEKRSEFMSRISSKGGKARWAKALSTGEPKA